MRQLLLSIFTCLFSTYVFGQQIFSIQGRVVDSISNVKPASTITILNAKDSILVKFVHTRLNEGAFNITGLYPGKFQLLITSRDYADYTDTFILDALNSKQNFGNINLKLKSSLLKEVVIKGNLSAIKIKGDTTEFNAAHYLMQANASIEDLVKKFPGMQIARDGSITFNGESIKRVLVDGEEFFGNDPTLVTRNLRADMVDKAQVYNRLTDQAKLTGVDDGKGEKVLNIKLKEDKKNGLFGKVEGGLATDQYYSGQAMFNKFTNLSKLSVYTITSNDGKTGFGYEDNNQLGISGDEGLLVSNLSDDYFSNYESYSGVGLPSVRNGGVHYDTKWNEEKQSINLNYKIGLLSITNNENSLLQQTLSPQETFIQNSDHYNYNHVFRQNADFVYRQKINSMSDLKLRFVGGLKNIDGIDRSVTTTTDFENNLLNRQYNSQIIKGSLNAFKAGLFYARKFKKEGRTISIDFLNFYEKSISTNNLQATVFIAQTAQDSITDQQKDNNLASNRSNLDINYSEPLSKNITAIINYKFEVNQSKADIATFNRSAVNEYDVLDARFSSNYKFDQSANQFGGLINYRLNKITVNVGTSLSLVNFDQLNLIYNTRSLYNFTNWAPEIKFNYRGSGKSFDLTYSGSNTLPTISQLQPLTDNRNLLNIIEGNPDLQSSYRNTLRAYYRFSKPISDMFLSISANYSNFINPIITNVYTDINEGRSISRYINLKNEKPEIYTLIVNYSSKIKKLGIRGEFGLSTYNYTHFNYINTQLNKSINNTFAAKIGLSKSKESKYTLSVSAEPNFSISKFSLNPQNNINAAGLNLNKYLEIILGKGFNFISDVNYSYKAETITLPAQYFTMWNAVLSKSFLKQQNLKLSISGNNLLDQKSYTRYTNAGVIGQTNALTIGRYIMCTLTWNFTKFAKTF